MAKGDEDLPPALQDALAEPIGEYMGKPVTAVSVKIMKTGDGLSKQMEIAPIVFVPGQRYTVLLDGIAGDHTHKLIEKADSWELVMTLNAETVTLVEGTQFDSKLRKAKDAVNKRAEARKGKARLDGMDAEDLEKDPPEDEVAAKRGQRADEWEDEKS